jgi:hypothetical protein
LRLVQSRRMSNLRRAISTSPRAGGNGANLYHNVFLAEYDLRLSGPEQGRGSRPIVSQSAGHGTSRFTFVERLGRSQLFGT